MLSVEMGSGNTRDEKLEINIILYFYLTTVGVGPRVCLHMRQSSFPYHGQQSGLIELKIEVFVFEPVAVYTQTAGSISLPVNRFPHLSYLHKVASLDHEVLNDTTDERMKRIGNRWNFVFLYPIGNLETLNSPVQSCLAVRFASQRKIPEILDCL